MTRDEILNMPAGSEMDALVAEKVMGWHIVADKDGWRHWDNVDGYYSSGILQCDGDNEDEEDFHIIHWHPSESILWAWEVVEKFVSTAERGYAKWQVVIHSDGMERWIADFKDDPLHTTNCSAPTAPLAICRAALLAVL
jgi:hypothetical protein